MRKDSAVYKQNSLSLKSFGIVFSSSFTFSFNDSYIFKI